MDLFLFFRQISSYLWWNIEADSSKVQFLVRINTRHNKEYPRSLHRNSYQAKGLSLGVNIILFNLGSSRSQSSQSEYDSSFIFLHNLGEEHWNKDKVSTGHETWPLIGPDRSRDQNTGLWFADTDLDTEYEGDGQRGEAEEDRDQGQQQRHAARALRVTWWGNADNDSNNILCWYFLYAIMCVIVIIRSFWIKAKNSEK